MRIETNDELLPQADEMAVGEAEAWAEEERLREQEAARAATMEAEREYLYDPPRTCWNCGRQVDGYWVGIEPVTFCSQDCEVHYQRKVQRAREMEEARRDR